MTLDLAISIINHSNPQMLRDCLRSIDATTHDIRFEIWVIDNATDRRLVSEIQAEFPSVKWLFNPARLGFSANHNQVLKMSSARYTCILNDDTLLHHGAMAELVKYLDAHLACGMAGPSVLNADGSIQNSTFRAKSLAGELFDILQLPGALTHLKQVGIDPAQYKSESASVDWLLGACLVIRRETLQQVGSLDDILSPIANCEEVDWCDRVRRHGWSVDFVPAAKITHFGGQSLKSESAGADRFRVEMHRVVIAYFAKQHGFLASMSLRAIYIMTLPWNGAMLAQSCLRGRLQKSEARSTLATLLGIARVALTPLERPYCRLDPVNPRSKTAPSLASPAAFTA